MEKIEKIEKIKTHNLTFLGFLTKIEFKIIIIKTVYNNFSNKDIHTYKRMDLFQTKKRHTIFIYIKSLTTKKTVNTIISLFFSSNVIKCVVSQLYTVDEKYHILTNNYRKVDDILLWENGEKIEYTEETDMMYKYKQYITEEVYKKNGNENGNKKNKKMTTMNKFLIFKYILMKEYFFNSEIPGIGKYTDEKHISITQCMEKLLTNLQIPYDQPRYTASYGQGLYDADTYISFYQLGYFKRLFDYDCDYDIYLNCDREPNTHTINISYRYDYIPVWKRGVNYINIDETEIFIGKNDSNGQISDAMSIQGIMEKVINVLCDMYKTSLTYDDIQTIIQKSCV